MTADPPSPTSAELSGGRYLLGDKLGEGGMGTVFRARDRHLETDVVIKLPHRMMLADPDFSQRFRDEIRSLVRLSHPHIVKVTDVGEWEGVPFAVLQYLSGGNLQGRQAAWRGHAALPALTSWISPIARALDYVHAQKLIHRDVKPANILFDEQGHAYLADFGVVKVLAAALSKGWSAAAALTATGSLVGTPHYMAPEMIMGEAMDGRVDQYALAVTAYEMICGHKPFNHEVPTRVLLMQAQDEPNSLTQHAPWVSPELDAAIRKGLAKNPDDRYPTCTAMADALIATSGVETLGRARVRCEGCHQTMTVSVEVLVTLSNPEYFATCPSCRNRLSLLTQSMSVLESQAVSPQTKMYRVGLEELPAQINAPNQDQIQKPKPPPTQANHTQPLNPAPAASSPSSSETERGASGFDGGKTEGFMPLPKPQAINSLPDVAGPVIPNPPWVDRINPVGAGLGVAIGGLLILGLATLARPRGTAESEQIQAPAPNLVGVKEKGPQALLAPSPPSIASKPQHKIKSNQPIEEGQTDPNPQGNASVAAVPSRVQEPPQGVRTPSPAEDQRQRQRSSSELPATRANELARAPDSQGSPPPQRVPSPTHERKPLRYTMGNSRSPSADNPINSSVTTNPNSEPEAVDRVENPGTIHLAEPAESRQTARSSESFNSKLDFPVVSDDEALTEKNVPLASLQKEPVKYAGGLITLEQVYCLSSIPWRDRDGSLKIAIVEADIELANHEAKVRLGDSFTLPIDPQLAEQFRLQRVMQAPAEEPPDPPKWIMQPSNLTLKVVKDPSQQTTATPARIVRVEMFEGFENEVRGSYKKHLVVLFKTRTFTAAGASHGMGNNDEWQKVRKLGHAHNQFQAFFKAMWNQQSQRNWTQFNQEMNQIITSGINQSIVNQAKVHQQIRELTTPKIGR